MDDLATAIEPLVLHEETKGRLPVQIAVLHDDDFAWFARYGLPIQARNSLKGDTKKSTSLWYEETLPPDTVMYALVAGRNGDAVDSLNALFRENDPYLQGRRQRNGGPGMVRGERPQTRTGDRGVRTIEQERATNALARVRELERQPPEFKERYRSYVDRLGPAIVMNGLGQALATERAAAGSNPANDDQRAHHELCESLERWLCREEGGVYPPGGDLLMAITSHDETWYLRAQVEALAWLEWHKKCCRASFPKGDGGGE